MAIDALSNGIYAVNKVFALQHRDWSCDGVRPVLRASQGDDSAGILVKAMIDFGVIGILTIPCAGLEHFLAKEESVHFGTDLGAGTVY